MSNSILNLNLPAQGAPLSSSAMRGQFALIESRLQLFASLEPFGLSVSNPPTQAEMQTLADKLGQVINLLRGEG